MNTPRTDAVTFIPALMRPEWNMSQDCVEADFARQLETELSEAKEYEQRLRSELIQARKQAQDCDQLRAELNKGCQCSCHNFPHHKTVQDFADANAWMDKEITQLRAEVHAYRNGGVTEELLRRQDGLIKVGKGCEIAIEGTTAKCDQWRECADRLAQGLYATRSINLGPLVPNDWFILRDKAIAAYEQLKGTK